MAVYQDEFLDFKKLKLNIHSNNFNNCFLKQLMINTILSNENKKK